MILCLYQFQSIATNIGYNMDNFTEMMHNTTPIASENYEVHGCSDFAQPSASILSKINRLQPNSVPGFGSMYSPQNDLNPPKSIDSQYFSANTMNEQQDHRVMNQSFNNEEDSTNNKFSTIPQKSTENISTEFLSNTKRQSLEKTLTIIENILINSNNNSKTDPLDSSSNDPLALDAHSKNRTENNEDSSDDEVLIKKVATKKLATKKVVSKKVATKKEKTKPPISNSDKVELEVLIGPSEVKIKVEETSWPDMAFTNPFHRDSNGISRHSISDNVKVVGMDNSIPEAMETIKNGADSAAYFECPHCSLLLIHPKRFLIHVKWHNFGMINKQREQQAKEREARYQERLKANNMKRVSQATDGELLPCNDCDMSFNNKISLQNHRRKHSKVKMECKVCMLVLTGRDELREHLQTHTDNKEGYHQCPNCPKRFKYRHSLTKHVGIHLEKNHPCPECSKMFGSEKLVKLHMKVHDRQARGTIYHCTYCGKGFYETYNLNVHERTHRNDKPFECDICHSTFVTNSSLKRHLKVSHSGAKPYECKVCFKCFATAPIRDRHELRVHADENEFPFPCELCPKRFMKSKDLKNHIYKSHQKNREGHKMDLE